MDWTIILVGILGILVLPRAVLWDIWVLPWIRRRIVRYCHCKTRITCPTITTAAMRWKQRYDTVVMAVFLLLFLSLAEDSAGYWIILGIVCVGIALGWLGLSRRNRQCIQLSPNGLSLTSTKGMIQNVRFQDIYRIYFFRFYAYRYEEFYPSVTIETKGLATGISKMSLTPVQYVILRRYCVRHQLPVQDSYAAQIGLPTELFYGTKEAPLGDYRDDTKPFRY